jgi:hypothetical protein
VGGVQDTDELARCTASEVVGHLRSRLSMHAGHANAVRAWPEGTELEAPYVFSPRKEARAKVNPGMYGAEVEDLLRQGGLVLQFIDVGEQVPVKNEETEDYQMVSIAHEDLWASVNTFFPHRVPVGDRIEGLSSLGRLIVAAIEQVVAVAGFDAVAKLKVRALSVDLLVCLPPLSRQQMPAQSALLLSRDVLSFGRSHVGSVR